MDFKERLVELARANVEAAGRPFSCLIVKDGVVLAEGVNRVAQTHDPTAHAEICAIREATAKLHTEHLIDCTFYILAHPCPMCLAAMYYCSPDRVVFQVTQDEYASFYHDDRKYITFSTFYDEFAKPWYQRTPADDPSAPSGWHRGVSALEGTQLLNSGPHTGCARSYRLIL